jgi:hypothetical protein
VGRGRRAGRGTHAGIFTGHTLRELADREDQRALVRAAIAEAQSWMARRGEGAPAGDPRDLVATWTFAARVDPANLDHTVAKCPLREASENFSASVDLVPRCSTYG